MDSSNVGGAQGTFFDVLALMQRALAMLDANGGAAKSAPTSISPPIACSSTCSNPVWERPKSR